MLRRMSSSSIAVRAARSLVILSLVIPVVAGCGGGGDEGKELDTRKIERYLGQDASSKLEVKGIAVSCPSTVDAGKDKTFTCTAQAPDSDEIDVDVRQKDAKGNVTWTMKARSTSGVVESIQDGILEQKKIKVTADCPDIIPIRKGAEFACVVVDAKGVETDVTIVETDDEGSVDWTV